MNVISQARRHKTTNSETKTTRNTRKQTRRSESKLVAKITVLGCIGLGALEKAQRGDGSTGVGVLPSFSEDLKTSLGENIIKCLFFCIAHLE